MISEMTPEQEALMSVYREKWRNIALSTERIDREQASEAIRKAYSLIGKEPPRIIFCGSPYDYTVKVAEFLQGVEPPNFAEAFGKLNDALSGYFQEFAQLNTVLDQVANTAIEQNDTLSPPLDEHIAQRFQQHFSSVLDDETQEGELDNFLKQEFPEFQPPNQLGAGLNVEIEQNNDLFFSLPEQATRRIQKRIFQLIGNLTDLYTCQIHNPTYRGLYALPNSDILWNVIHNCTAPDSLAANYTLFDFYISVLGCEHDPEKWQASVDVLQSCGYTYAFEHFCFICDRPTKISLDETNRLHAEGEPAILFADGYSVYGYRGVTLQGKYIDIHPRDWEGSWYLEESSSELRRAIVEALPQADLQSQWLFQENETELQQRLIERIGYERVCAELQAEELDSSQESVLFKIEVNRDQESRDDDSEDEAEPIIFLKKLTLDSDQVQIICLPYDITSVQEALEWLSYGTEPD